MLKPCYTSVGISDETTGIVKMKVHGNISTKNLEDDEELEVIKLKRNEVKGFVESHNFSIKSALILLYAIDKL